MKKIFFLISWVIIACSVSKKMNQQNNTTVVAELPVFDKEGHRGCRGLMPENTIPAMLKALELGVTTLEMDTHITRDSLVIISHDPYFNHDITTKPDGTFLTEKEEKQYVLYRMNYAETQLFDVGLKPHPRFPGQQKMAVHKPLLSDLIDSVEAYCKIHSRPLPFYNIETKSQALTDDVYHPKPAVFIKLLMAVIRSKGIEARVIIQSFDPRTLQVLHQDYPAVKTALLIEGFDKRTMDAQFRQLGFTPTIYSPYYSLVTDELVRQCHLQHIKLIPWTVNDRASIDRLKSMGVDGIISDYPNLFFLAKYRIRTQSQFKTLRLCFLIYFA